MRGRPEGSPATHVSGCFSSPAPPRQVFGLAVCGKTRELRFAPWWPPAKSTQSLRSGAAVAPLKIAPQKLPERKGTPGGCLLPSDPPTGGRSPPSRGSRGSAPAPSPPATPHVGSAPSLAGPEGPGAACGQRGDGWLGDAGCPGGGGDARPQLLRPERRTGLGADSRPAPAADPAS